MASSGCGVTEVEEGPSALPVVYVDVDRPQDERLAYALFPFVCGAPLELTTPLQCVAVTESGPACGATSGYALIGGECHQIRACGAGETPTTASIFTSRAECAWNCASAGHCRTDKKFSVISPFVFCDRVDARVVAKNGCIERELDAFFPDWFCGSEDFYFGSCPSDRVCCTRWRRPHLDDFDLRACAVTLFPEVEQVACVVYI